MVIDFLRKCGHKDLEVVLFGRNPGFFVIVTEREDSKQSLSMSRILHVFGVPAAMKMKLDSTLYVEEVIILLLSVTVGHGYLQHLKRERNNFYRLRYRVCLSSSDVQPKNAIALVYVDSLTTNTTIGADCESGEVEETHDQVTYDLEGKEAADVSEIENYFMFLEIPEE